MHKHHNARLSSSFVHVLATVCPTAMVYFNLLDLFPMDLSHGRPNTNANTLVLTPRSVLTHVPWDVMKHRQSVNSLCNLTTNGITKLGLFGFWEYFGQVNNFCHIK